jgi:hypothetical protein
MRTLILIALLVDDAGSAAGPDPIDTEGAAVDTVLPPPPALPRECRETARPIARVAPVVDLATRRRVA